MRLSCPSNVAGMRSSTARAARADVGHDAEVTPNVGPSALHWLSVIGVPDGAAVDIDGAGAAVSLLPRQPDSATAANVEASATRTRLSLIPPTVLDR